VAELIVDEFDDFEGVAGVEKQPGSRDISHG